jgi:hypothetical protein
MNTNIPTKWLAVGISIVSVILLTLTSLTNVVGHQTVQTSQQNIIKERINQKELLFKTIVDIANNKEIQRIILKSQMSRGIFPTTEFPVVTKQQIRQIYFLGFILSKVINKSRIHSMIQQYQLLNPNIQEGINGVIEKDVTLRNEITQLQSSECDCEKRNTTRWRYPIICNMLNILSFGLGITSEILNHMINDGKLRDHKILLIMALLALGEIVALLVMVDCLINIYCEMDSLK